jgi:hypothetical protein
MKTKLAFSVLALSAFGLTSLGAPTASNRAQTAQTKDKSASVRTLTGCVTAGEKAGDYSLTAEDGSTWEISSKTVKLSPHVGHTVKVTGKVWHPEMHGAKEKAKDAVESNPVEHGHLSVTNLIMVSETCK